MIAPVRPPTPPSGAWLAPLRSWLSVRFLGKPKSGELACPYKRVAVPIWLLSALSALSLLFVLFFLLYLWGWPECSQPM